MKDYAGDEAASAADLDILPREGGPNWGGRCEEQLEHREKLHGENERRSRESYWLAPQCEFRDSWRFNMAGDIKVIDRQNMASRSETTEPILSTHVPG